MKITMKFGNVKYAYEGELNNLFSDYDMLLGLYSKYSSDFLKMISKNAPAGIESYYGNLSKIFDGYASMNRPVNGFKQDDPNSLPANGHDIYNYVARYRLANYQIQAVMKLDGHIDFARLSRAVRLSVDAEPVFGCRFVENEPPYWKRLKNIDTVEFCDMVETENPDEAIQLFLDSPLDMDHDPMVKVRLIRSEQYDTLCVKNNHACCDGAGTKEYIKLLSEIYSITEDDYGTFTAKPAKRSRKDQDRLFSSLGITDPEKEWIPGSEITRATWPFPWSPIQSDRTHISVCSLPDGLLDDMTNYSKVMNATINDLILTAFYRAMSKTGQPVYDEHMEIPLTIDLRRYLPNHKTEVIRNFSGSEFTKLSLVPDESFIETLSRVTPMMNVIKNNIPGLQSAIGLERIEKMAFNETLAYYRMVSQWPNTCGDKCAPVLSNLGHITKSLIEFGKTAVTEAYIVPPVVRAPGFLLMVSTYNGIITLSAGIYEASIPQETIHALLNNIKDELIEQCYSPH